MRSTITLAKGGEIMRERGGGGGGRTEEEKKWEGGREEGR